MGRPYNKTHFDDPNVLREMLTLRYGDPPWSYKALGRKFGNVDHSTIVYHVQKARRMGITPATLGSSQYYPPPPSRTNRPRFLEGDEHRYLWRVQVIGPTTPCVPLLPAAPPPKPKPWEKYRHLIEDECVRVNPGRSYREYKKIGKNKRAAARTELTKKLTAEFEERMRKRGRIDVRGPKRPPHPPY